MTARVLVATALVLVLVLGTSCGKPPEKRGGAAVATDTAAALGKAEATGPEAAGPKPFFLQFYKPPQLEVEAKIPQYTLPLEPEGIINWTVASKHFKCARTAELILANGFAVEEGWGETLGAIDTAYDDLPHGVPTVVTVDTVLHIQHLLYDQLFKQLEKTVMVDDVRAITAAGLDWFSRSYAA